MFHFVDLCVVNAWIVYRALKRVRLQLVDFKFDVAVSLIKSTQVVQDISRPQNGVMHFLIENQSYLIRLSLTFAYVTKG